MRWLLGLIDGRDLFFFTGLGLVVAGVWREYGMEHGFITAGVILLFVSMRK